jgi:GntR family transcriptional regulator
MEFFIDQHSSVPVINQIQEQVKIAVAMGIVRSGDNLPSIREVEKQAGIHRSQVHRAYQALSQSGLLVLTPGRGRGAVVSANAAPSDLIENKCRKLTKDLVSSVRGLGLSPTAYARYLNQQLQEFERRAPFIGYVDPQKIVATTRAAEVSRSWHVPVIGLSLEELKRAAKKGTPLRKILTAHLVRDLVQFSLLGRRIEVIPIEVRYSEQTVRELSRIRSHSSVLRVLPAHLAPYARFILDQLHKWIKAPGIDISFVPQADISFEELLRGSAHSHIIVDPTTLSEIPPELQQNSRILVVRFQLDPISLETARIRAGVIA